MTKVVVWYSVQNGGDGSAYPGWFLTEEDAQYDQDNMCEGWGESCLGSIETFEGSDVHTDAKGNSFELMLKRDWVGKSESEVTSFLDIEGVKWILRCVDGKYADLPQYTPGLIFLYVESGIVTEADSW
jgi:hypothetical protein